MQIDTIELDTGLADSPVHAIGRLRSWTARAVAVVDDWRQRARSRARLRERSDYELRDIGLSRADVFFETEKPFWRP